MSLAAAALKRARFTLVGAVGVLLAGFAALFGFPSTEEPIVPFRFATIEALMPGASSERTEQLVARPIEERVRQIAEVKTVETVVRPGYAASFSRATRPVRRSSLVVPPTTGEKISLLSPKMP